MKKKIITVFTIAYASLLMVACGSTIPDLTVEQTEMVTEYAAGLLLKYDTKTPSRLLPEGTVTEMVFVDVPAKNDNSITKTDSEPEVSADDTVVNDLSNGNTSSSNQNVWEELLPADGLKLEYAGNFEIVDSYPTDSDSIYFVTDATDGNKLVVIHFNLTNNMQSVNEVKMNKYNLKYRISINGGDNRFIYTTMLNNDILSCAYSLEPGETVDIVAVSEVDESEAANIQTLDFIIRGENGSSVIKLQ